VQNNLFMADDAEPWGETAAIAFYGVTLLEPIGPYDIGETFDTVVYDAELGVIRLYFDEDDQPGYDEFDVSLSVNN
jgi:hypothetical protein